MTRRDDAERREAPSFVTEETKRTLREWFAYLDSETRELTLLEFQALMIFNQREYVRIILEMLREIQNAGEHTEAMLGALDVLASQLASLNGLQYAGSHEIRAALDRQRDALRLAEAQAAGGDQNGARTTLAKLLDRWR